jgi:hypothetical protein
MENQLAWHSRSLSQEEYRIAVQELDAAQRSLAQEGQHAGG